MQHSQSGSGDPYAQSETRVTFGFEELETDELEVPTLTILAHPDPRRVGETSALSGLYSGLEARLSRLEPRFAAPGSTRARPLADLHLSRRPIHMHPGPGAGDLALTRSGSRMRLEIDGVALDQRRVLTRGDMARGTVLEVGRRVVLMLHLGLPMSPGLPSFGLVGESAPMVRLRQELGLVGDLDVPVLLRGASGTGKDLVARAIHDASPRRGPFLAVSCAALSPATAALELFGGRSGTQVQEGFFRRARGGTLFFDDVGATPPAVQPLLLRALESGEIQPVGTETTEKVDVRVIAATDADLAAMVAEGSFRAPLYHRLATYELAIPPLRERLGDVGRLLYHFLDQELRRLGDSGIGGATTADRPWPPAEAVARLARHPWPGNVRELRNAACRLTVAHRSGDASVRESLLESILSIDGDLNPSASSPTAPTEPSSPGPPTSSGTGGEAASAPTGPEDGMRAVDRDLLERVEGIIETHLGDEEFHVDALADHLAMGRSPLYRRLRRLTGRTPAKMILERRLQRAAKMLGRGEGTVGEIAYAVGFKSPSHFSQAFRDRYGVTPSAYAADEPRDRG
ncbi:MAG: sigma 54-interacting transcriptional regulator [Acidobacteriota bacterium]